MADFTGREMPKLRFTWTEEFFADVEIPEFKDKYELAKLADYVPIWALGKNKCISSNSGIDKARWELKNE